VTHHLEVEIGQQKHLALHEVLPPALLQFDVVVGLVPRDHYLEDDAAGLCYGFGVCLTGGGHGEGGPVEALPILVI
jgi:hypothetical protein